MQNHENKTRLVEKNGNLVSTLLLDIYRPFKQRCPGQGNWPITHEIPGKYTQVLLKTKAMEMNDRN